jgi:hypothetical protein
LVEGLNIENVYSDNTDTKLIEETNNDCGAIINSDNNVSKIKSKKGKKNKK